MIGQTISHYRITEKLGEGGMGIVYKAQDTKLDRPVALKFLAPHLLRDEEGRKRFEREAKASAKLDHPNICTVYEIDEADGRTFIVMAFLEGRPLSKRIDEGPLKLPEALSIAIQMAEGLEAAHAKGITHRDIKPDNVMLMSGSRGLVKLMDFGLAQLAGSSKLTHEGTTLGTPVYMSPEQALGQSTDQRSDVWGLGVVLHEMVAGRPPFKGEFDQAVIYAIVNEQHEPLTAVRTGVPKDLERIVDKCLAKEADERYQHVTDLLVDLQACRRVLEPVSERAGPKRAEARRTSPALIGTGAVVLLAVLGLGWWFGRSSEPSVEGPPEYRLTQITRDTGYTGDPALSPDGSLLAYASDRGGENNLDIWVQQLGGGDPIRLTTHEADDSSPSFSPDGSRIAFRSERDDGGIYVMPALGGTPRRMSDRGSNPRFAPDGDRVSYFAGEYNADNQRFSRTWIFSESGGRARQIETKLGIAEAQAWSPDGQHLLVVGSMEPREYGRTPEFDWWLVGADDGEATPLGVREPFEAAGLVLASGWIDYPQPQTWLSEGNWLIFDARTRGGTWNLWRIRISPEERRLLGKPQKLTAGIGEQGASAAQDGRIAFMNVSENWDIWSLPLDANSAEVTGAPERIVSGLSTDWYPSVSADGRKLAYASDRAGNSDIWLRDLATNEDTPVTVGLESELRGVISPDGTKVVFGRAEEGKTNVYLTQIGRSGEKLLLEDVGGHMDWTPDGKKILFYTTSPIRWKTVDVETGQQQDLGLQHSQYAVHSVRFSPDQNWVSFKLLHSTVHVAKMVGGAAQDEDQWIAVGDPLDRGHSWWSPDGNTLYFLSIRDDFRCIWAQSLDPATKQPQGPLKAVQHLHGRFRYDLVGGSYFGYALTADKHYLPLRETKGNIWLAEPQ